MLRRGSTARRASDDVDVDSLNAAFGRLQVVTERVGRRAPTNRRATQLDQISDAFSGLRVDDPLADCDVDDDGNVIDPVSFEPVHPRNVIKLQNGAITRCYNVTTVMNLLVQGTDPFTRQPLTRAKQRETLLKFFENYIWSFEENENEHVSYHHYARKSDGVDHVVVVNDRMPTLWLVGRWPLQPSPNTFTLLNTAPQRALFAKKRPATKSETVEITSTLILYASVAPDPALRRIIGAILELNTRHVTLRDAIQRMPAGGSAPRRALNAQRRKR